MGCFAGFPDVLIGYYKSSQVSSLKCATKRVKAFRHEGDVCMYHAEFRVV